jgi:hypothetical protein
MSTEAGGQAIVRAQPVCKVYFPGFLPARIYPIHFPLALSLCSSNCKLLRDIDTLTPQKFLWFPCGIIRGALASMGINATVQAETSELPGATFQIKSIVSKA